MLRPEKHLSLKYCLLNVSAVILEKLKSLSTVSVNELEVHVVNRLGKEAESVFVRSLTFLHALGVLDFDVDSDMIFLCNGN